ncbi:hypothetical protein GF362_05940 [Candidatus Dojkabacteria bacterium]|nr:hypothetical protein [Candidatus Dojkabacteria bacterium]
MEEVEKIYTKPFLKIESDEQDLIGVQGTTVAKILQSGVNLPSGFIITTHAFDNFLIANDLVAEIQERMKNVDSKSRKKLINASNFVNTLFKEAVIPSSIYDAIRVSYSNLFGLSKGLVKLYPSWIPEVYPYNAGVDHKYSFTAIEDMNSLEEVILKSWQVLFDPMAIFERFENNYNGTLSVALVVQKMLNAEMSGKAYSYNPISNEENEVEIEALLGLYKGVAELGVIPDRYIVSKEHERIVEKNTSGQREMMVMKGMFKTKESKEHIVKVSKPWQVRQKISDKQIQELTIILKTIERELGKQVELEWVIETGKLYVVDFKIGKTLEKYKLMQDGEVKRSIKVEPGIEVVSPSDQSKKKEPKKTLDDYIDEIEQEIDNFGSVSVPPEDINNKASSLATEIKKEENTPKKVSKEQAKEKEVDIERTIEPKIPKLWKKFTFTKLKDVEPQVVDIWLDMSEGLVRGELNSNEFDGLYGLYGEDLLEGFGVNIVHLDKKQLVSLKNYIVDQIFELISQDLSKHTIYSISNLTHKQADKYLNESKEGIDLHLTNQILIEQELAAIREIRGKRGYRKIWVGIRGLNQVEELKNIKSIISKAGIKRSSMFKIFVEIDKLPVFLNINDYLKENVDGVILYLDVIFQSLLGNKISIQEVLENDVFWDMVEKLSLQIHKKGRTFFVNSNVLASTDELILKLLKLGINGVCIGGEKIYDMRKNLTKLERQILKQKK